MTKEQEMLSGYLCGLEHKKINLRHLDDKSAAYKHGYKNGVADANNTINERASVSRRRANIILGASSNKQ